MSQRHSDVRFILVRPKIAGNIGSVARVLVNMGFDDLVIVDPQADPHSEVARRRASRAGTVLDRALITESLPEALEGIVYTVGATCRPGLYRSQSQLTPRELASIVVERSEPTATVLGPEDFGLSNDDVLCCDATVRIPAHDDYPSLNLSHAAAVLAYELFLAFETQHEKMRVGETPLEQQQIDHLTHINPLSAEDEADDDPEAPADGSLMAALMHKLEDPLSRIGYLNPENPRHLLVGLRQIFARARLTRRDVQILMGLAQQLTKYIEHGYDPDRVRRMPQPGRNPDA